MPSAGASLGGVVVHWHDEEGLGRLLETWPPAFPLVVVDNSRSLAGTATGHATLVVPMVNLGFGGGVNRGARELRHVAPSCRFLLILNPDAAPEAGAVEQLVQDCSSLANDPTCAGVAPALLNADGSTQHAWQLQPLPSAWTLLGQVFFQGGARGPRHEPAEGTLVEQPAAAVLALDLERFDHGGHAFEDPDDSEETMPEALFDPGFYPAWFDDVDLARRLRTRGLAFRYAPKARFFHARGGSVPALGYGRFLWVYYRNLTRYLGKHHGVGWKFLASALLPLSMTARLLLLPLRSPKRANSRFDAARGLLAVIAGAVSGWRFPHAWANDFARPDLEASDV